MPQPLSTTGKDPVPIVQEAGWAPGLIWTGAENLAPTGIRSPERPAYSQSLYQLSYRILPIDTTQLWNTQIIVKQNSSNKHTCITSYQSSHIKVKFLHLQSAVVTVCVTPA
jgi:hypothetical protein